MTDFTLPELGENITAGDVLRILVQPGDALKKDQPVLELETDKATIEVPSSVAGQVKEIKVKPGDKVKVGQAILSVDDSANTKPDDKAATGKPVQGKAVERAAAQADAPAQPDAKDETNPGEGPLDPHVEGERREPSADTSGVVDQSRGQKVVDISRGARASAEPVAGSDVPAAPAAPSVRRMARELGVDIHDVSGTGSGGRVSVDDVKAHVNRLVSAGAAGASGAAAAEALPDFARWGGIERQAMKPVRRKTAAHLAAAWAAIPHVTQHDLADVTSLEEMRKQYAPKIEKAGGNLTVTAIAVMIAAAALRRFPQFNSSVDMASEEIIYKKYVHIGVAVDTDRGLLVPVIRDADAKNLTEISIELAQLSEKARNRKLTLEEMQGGCFSISNLGGIGGTAFTPIVNAPEVAILGISRGRREPVYAGDELVPRLMLPLSLSYDHRVIDGADGIRFLRWIVEAFEQPFLLALEG